jgi:hypothetical protein
LKLVICARPEPRAGFLIPGAINRDFIRWVTAPERRSIFAPAAWLSAFHNRGSLLPACIFRDATLRSHAFLGYGYSAANRLPALRLRHSISLSVGMISPKLR